MDVFHLDGASEQGCDIPWTESRDATAYFGDQEGQLGMLFGEGDELVDVRNDGLHTALHRRDGIALSLQSNALTHDGAKPLDGDPSSAAAMHALQVAAEDKDLILAEAGDVFGRDAFFKVFFNHM